ncbi:MAG: rRNA pseudouridine synthase [Bacteroidaceae bacterium]|nr:rRNA pseudouridine synthase [Bacteroidaceae bacterium]MBQ4622845.1 rRNA pseudouridine synthase [Bacteroidaceae bacterium]MBQ6801053.1 rRNA pseudouridine synthase [Bacteroidaceae bacterium]
MMTDNEKWRNGSDENQEGANDGYNRGYNRENRFNSYNSYNREEGGQRQFRSGGYSSRMSSFGNRTERPQRPRITRSTENAGGEGRPRFTRVNGNNAEGGYAPRYQRPQRSYDNNYRQEGAAEGRPFRPSSYNSNRPSYGDRPQRPRFNGNGGGYNNMEERPRFNNGGYGQARPQQRRPGGFGNGGGRPQQGGMRQRTPGYNPNAKYSKKKQIEYKEILADPNEPIRLNKFLANAGICSRREADEFITAGVVSVNGEIVTELGTKVKRSDVIKFHDQQVSAERKVYILLNKPKDCVTTSDDPQERKTVMDLVKGACAERIYPVGRLDRNTTGVLLLTNDGDLASKLTHPKFLKKKIYHVYCDKNVTKADLDQIAAGITLEDGEIHADAISYAHETDKKQVGIEIHSGKNRIVRRIFESLGYKVTKLDRVSFAGLTKKGVRRGDWRFLTEAEVNMLRIGAFA